MFESLRSTENDWVTNLSTHSSLFSPSSLLLPPSHHTHLWLFAVVIFLLWQLSSLFFKTLHATRVRCQICIPSSPIDHFRCYSEFFQESTRMKKRRKTPMRRMAEFTHDGIHPGWFEVQCLHALFVITINALVVLIVQFNIVHPHA